MMEALMKTNLWLIIPCYNEEEVLPTTISKLSSQMDSMIWGDLITSDSKMLFIDDGSKDKTWQLIKESTGNNKFVQGIKLSRNQGHQNALLAGMMYASGKCDCIISLDADLQDDISVLPEFVKRYQEGYQVVYGVRNNRETDTGFKRNTASLFYKLMKLLGAETVENHADYRLLGRQALQALMDYKEVNLFLRGIVPLLGFESITVFYERKERAAGKTKYPLKKMLSFALDGITSFSIKPLRLISSLGIVCSILSTLGLLYALISHIAGLTVPGWTAIVCSIWLLGGIQLLCLGVVGEYIGKIFSEVKRRPRYIIEELSLNNYDHRRENA